MGIRIDAHAVDASAFAALIHRPLWWLLAELRRAPVGSDILFSANDRQAKQRYVVLPDRRAILRSGPTSSPEELTDQQLMEVPLLRLQVGSYLRAESSYALMFLLRALPWLMPGGHVEITSGVKRWWIESILAATAGGVWDDVAGLAELKTFFGRMLRGYGFDLPLPRHDAMPPAGSFPALPSDDADMWMAVFSEPESRRFGELAELLRRSGFTFGAPPGRWFQDTDAAAWHEHVMQMLSFFGRLRDLTICNLRLVTFIG